MPSTIKGLDQNGLARMIENLKENFATKAEATGSNATSSDITEVVNASATWPAAEGVSF